MKKIICFHLYNDYSGSPRVLKMILEGLQKEGYSIEIITSKGGILDQLKDLKGIKIRYYKYHYSTNKLKTAINYLFIQLYTFFLAFTYIFNRNILFYINTILPVGPAFAGFIMRKEVIYHCHENINTSNKLYTLLGAIMSKIANKIICVSKYQSTQITTHKQIYIIPNSVSTTFYNHFKNINYKILENKKTVLLLSSLKRYKGTIEFIQLAKSLPQYHFLMVINDKQKNINNFLASYNLSLPTNIQIYSQQKNIIPFYEKASLLINLSNPHLFIETFGLTAIEGMTAALPVIVPTIGGISEFVQDNINGFKLDVNNLEEIRQKIDYIFTNPNIYNSLSVNAKKTSEYYNYNKMLAQILNVIK
jgi:glycosyltransferase involved in cell wall biosynthesis